MLIRAMEDYCRIAKEKADFSLEEGHTELFVNSIEFLAKWDHSATFIILIFNKALVLRKKYIFYFLRECVHGKRWGRGRRRMLSRFHNPVWSLTCGSISYETPRS